MKLIADDIDDPIVKTVGLCDQASMKILKSVLFLLTLGILAFAGLIWAKGLSNDFDRPFVNDGEENDLKVVSNTKWLFAYPDTAICGRGNITPQATYYLFGASLGSYEFYSDPKYTHSLESIGGIFQSEGKYYFLNSRRHSWDYQDCRKNRPRDIFTTMKIVLIKRPDRFGVWLRSRQDGKYITIFHKYQSSADDLGGKKPFESRALTELMREIGKARIEMTKRLKVNKEATMEIDASHLIPEISGERGAEEILDLNAF